MVSGSTRQAVGRLLEEEEEEEDDDDDDEIAVFPISRPDSDVLAMLGYFLGKRPLQKHSKPSK